MTQSGGTVDLGAYRLYMRQRFAPSTVKPRMMVAYEWRARCPDPAAATYRDVEDWIRDRALSASSTRNLLVCLRAFYRWLQREGLVVTDPTVLVDHPRVPRRLPRPAPERVVGRILRTTDIQLRALYALQSCAGLRCVECSRLDWRDVDLDAGVIIVDGKGRVERTIDLSADVIRTMRQLRMASVGRNGAVFVGPGGRRLAPHRVSQLVNQALHADGHAETAHQLRHRCATAALQVPGADLLAVRDLMGHASVATTQIYTQVIAGRTAATSRALQFPAA